MSYERVLNIENPFKDDDSATLYENNHDDNIITGGSQTSSTHEDDNIFGDNKSEVTQIGRAHV